MDIFINFLTFSLAVAPDLAFERPSKIVNSISYSLEVPYSRRPGSHWIIFFFFLFARQADRALDFCAGFPVESLDEFGDVWVKVFSFFCFLCSWALDLHQIDRRSS
jgi:hypothetical protein